MYDAFTRAQIAYDNMTDPAYDDTEDEAREQWLEDTQIIDMIGEDGANEILNELAFGKAANAADFLRSAIDTAWEKHKKVAFDDGY